jgi:DNA-binding response OmpR family regulator
MDKLDPPSVLVVDSEPLLVETVAAALSLEGFQVIKAWTCADARQYLLDCEIDVLIAHGHLPGDEGPFSFAVEASVNCPSLAIVAVTSDIQPGHPFPPGRASILVKPFGLGALLGAISQAELLVAPLPPLNPLSSP